VPRRPGRPGHIPDRSPRPARTGSVLPGCDPARSHQRHVELCVGDAPLGAASRRPGHVAFQGTPLRMRTCSHVSSPRLITRAIASS
jgi:hypothetical protein